MIEFSDPTQRICPLFWLRGEPEEILREEIRQMRANGIGAFIAESRPHPDWLEEGWWRTLGWVIDEARQQHMKVWLFDDCHYPSLNADGRIARRYPHLTRKYLAERHIDAVGPHEGSSFLIQSWLESDEELVRVVVGRRAEAEDALDPDTLVDVTASVQEGTLYWSVPDGFWRVFIFVKTSRGGENHMENGLNPLLPEATDAYLEIVHQAHFERLGSEFGKTIAGFFTDEPRFSNAPTYEAIIGRWPMVLPWSDRVLDQLSVEFGSDFSTLLPCLWYDAGKLSVRARYAFMDLVSRLYGANVTQRIGDWCRAHGVGLIGHVVEDSGAHARLGYGAGHFFRAIAGQDVSGLDIVHQVWPGGTHGRRATPFGNLDNEFFYWGIAPLAVSAAHINPHMNDTTMCEIFGAYGWKCGLRLMKWLTDFACVRGVNFLVPHAFSPQFPDPDCPPHFYARGQNPQWRYFKQWAEYASRVCALISERRREVSVATLYHAEAEWAGEAQPFQAALHHLATAGIDCDVMPADALLKCEAEDGIRAGNRTYRALIVPAAELLPLALLHQLYALGKSGCPICFVDRTPRGASDTAEDVTDLLACLQTLRSVTCCSLHALPNWCVHNGLAPAMPGGYEYPADLRVARYSREGAPEERLYYLFNESRTEALTAAFLESAGGAPVVYDAMLDRRYRPQHTRDGEMQTIRIVLQPGQSCFLFPNRSAQEAADLPLFAGHPVPVGAVSGSWQVSSATAETYPEFQIEAAITGPGNVASPELLPKFSGTLRYEMVFSWDKAVPNAPVLDLGEVYEIAEVTLNDVSVATCICPPYRFEVAGALREGENRLRIDVTNTLAKALGNNWLDRAVQQDPTGLIGPVQIVMLNGE